MAASNLFDEAADELYGLPPGEFTRGRDARAKEVRSGGDRETADAIKGLRKPTVAAWALNQLARRRAKDVERLVEAGEELRAAQEELLAGGNRAAFQETAGRERELVADLSSDATAMANEAGERGSGLHEKIAETLHAAALDEETADELRAGRLVREREAIGGFSGTAAAEPAPQARGGRGAPKSAPPSKAPAPAKRASGRKEAPDAKAQGRAAAKQAEQRQRVSAARTDERHARRELESAERGLAHAQERADAAAAHAEEAAERARATAERLKDARRAATAARRAHHKAERALQSAEGGSSRRS